MKIVNKDRTSLSVFCFLGFFFWFVCLFVYFGPRLQDTWHGAAHTRKWTLLGTWGGSALCYHGDLAYGGPDAV